MAELLNANIPFLGDVSDAAINQFGLDRSVLDSLITPSRVPRTRTRTSHSLLIRVAGGRVIGAINGFTHQTRRTIDQEWGCNATTTGAEPSDLIPQNVEVRTLSIKRYDLFVRTMEQIIDETGEMVSLADQFRPFSLRTIWQSPVSSLLGGRAVYQYDGCYFSSLGRTAGTSDNRIINTDAEIIYKGRIRVQ